MFLVGSAQVEGGSVGKAFSASAGCQEKFSVKLLLYLYAQKFMWNVCFPVGNQ